MVSVTRESLRERLEELVLGHPEPVIRANAVNLLTTFVEIFYGKTNINLIWMNLNEGPKGERFEE
jgi:hypothetical protein